MPKEYQTVDGLMARPGEYLKDEIKRCANCANWQPTYKNRAKFSTWGICSGIEIVREFYNLVDESEGFWLMKTPHDWKCASFTE